MVEYKTLLDRNNRNSGPRRTTRSDDNILRVYESALDDPKLSIRKRSTKLGIPRATLQKIMTKDLGLYPYRISNRHSTEQRDLPARLRLAGSWGDADEDLADNVWWTDESHIHLNAIF